MRLPGVAWIALIVLLSEWIERWQVGGEWAPAIVIVLGAIAKILELWIRRGEVHVTSQAAQRFLLG